ncbi:putative Crp/Fnr-family transriptional regulator [Marinobacterium nitratireducens]|uniref:Crp/Fnr-family transriptional regulator n=1 Tax=Marinobacterium nitratireducens TaxID=518897 RepID=A0A917ZIB2_9GAMM|nr:Crp/Fnr family transcriptional regulator [Marinobacterium nitratireducens]GGO83303.1 putative Crp/Fnr-family transriptional regulator [Marinobacterium nitratireducens]
MVSPTELFPELSPEDLHILTSNGVTRNYPKNAVLITEGDQSDSLYIILTGKVKVFLSDEHGKEVQLNIQGPGEYFGELALIDQAPRSASVMTLEPSRLAVVSKADFQRCLAEHPEIAVELIRCLVQQVRSLTEAVGNMAMKPVYERVACTLLKLATERNNSLVIEERLTHQDIANMVGASREMVSRIMKDLSTGGYIQVRDRKIFIQEKLPAGW